MSVYWFCVWRTNNDATRQIKLSWLGPIDYVAKWWSTLLPNDHLALATSYFLFLFLFWVQNVPLVWSYSEGSDVYLIHLYIYICKYLYKHTISSCFFCYNKLSVKSRSEKNMEKSIKSVENTIVVQVTFFLHNFWHYHAYYHTAAWVRAKVKTCYIKRNLTYRTNPTWRALVNTLNRHC